VPISVRQVTPFDNLAQVQALAKDAWVSGHRHLFSSEEIAEVMAAHDDSIFTTSWTVPKTGMTFLAFDGATLAGAVELRPFPNELGRPALVEPMGVRPGHQRHGVGRALWDHLRWYSRKRGDCQIDVYALDRNPMAMSFYKKMGGQIVGPAELRLGEHVEPASHFLFMA
jgi:GNAT superfamily N-acetyltransferase